MRSFPEGGPAHQVSTDGGVYPLWSPDGRLFYRGLNGMMMVVAGVSSGEYHADTPRPLFDASRYDNFYGVAPDGKRFR